MFALETWRADIFRRRELGILREAAPLGLLDDWPTVDELDRLLRPALDQVPLGPVHLREQPAKPRRQRNPSRTYEQAAALERTIFTRPRSYHDLFNALVWSAFPRSKSALATRLYRAASRRRPGAQRSREHDALAMLDEGGVLLVGDGARTTPLIFGHAIYEHLVASDGDVRCAAVVLPTPTDEFAHGVGLRAYADQWLAQRLSDSHWPEQPADFGSYFLSDVSRCFNAEPQI